MLSFLQYVSIAGIIIGNGLTDKKMHHYVTSSLMGNPDMHHGTCMTHVTWCMSGFLTRGFLWNRWRETFQAFPAHAQPAIYVYGKSLSGRAQTHNDPCAGTLTNTRKQTKFGRNFYVLDCTKLSFCLFFPASIFVIVTLMSLAAMVAEKPGERNDFMHKDAINILQASRYHPIATQAK